MAKQWCRRHALLTRLWMDSSKTDLHLISLNNVPPESNIKVKRIKEMMRNLKNSWLLIKFSLSEPEEMYRE